MTRSLAALLLPALLLLAPVAAAQAPGTAEALVVEVDPEVPVDGPELRAQLAADLARPVELGAAVDARMSLRVLPHPEGQELRLVLRGPEVPIRTRVTATIRDRREMTRVVALLAANLVRDEASELLSTLRVERREAEAVEVTMEVDVGADPEADEETPAPPPRGSEAPEPEEDDPEVLAPPPEASALPDEPVLVGVDFLPGVGTSTVRRGRDVRGVSFGILGSWSGAVSGMSLSAVADVTGPLDGGQASGVASIADGPIEGAQLAGVAALGTDGVRGFQFGGVLAGGGGDLEGVQAAGVGVYAEYVAGAQLAGVFALAGGDVEGLQLGAVVNVAGGHVAGAQLGLLNVAGDGVDGLQAGLLNLAGEALDGGAQLGLLNVAGGDSGGAQVGLLNTTGSLEGAQIGLLNLAGGPIRGVQVGLLNIAESADAGIGLLSIYRRGRSTLRVSGDSQGFLGGSVTHGAGVTHNLYEVAVNPFVADTPLRVGAGFGLRATWDRALLDFDLMAHGALFFGQDVETDLLPEARITLGLRPFEDGPVGFHVSLAYRFQLSWRDRRDVVPLATILGGELEGTAPFVQGGPVLQAGVSFE
jgi:hypothetical protein